MTYKVYIFPAIAALTLLATVHFKLAPLIEGSIKMNNEFSEVVAALPSRIASGEISADDAVKKASTNVPSFLSATNGVFGLSKAYLYLSVFFLGIGCFLSAYFAARATREAPNHSFKGTPNGAP